MKKVVLVLALVALSGCVTERVIVRDRAPPPVIYEDASLAPPIIVVEETITVRPSPVHVWVGGHWGWYGQSYRWAPGYWVRPPRVGADWSQGVWVRFGGGWRWRQGYWRKISCVRWASLRSAPTYVRSRRSRQG